MRLSIVFSRICLIWLFYSQAIQVISLWHIESDVGEMFNSQVLDRAFRQVLNPSVVIGMVVLLALGILQLLVYAVRKPAPGNTTWTISGIIYLILAFIGVVLIAQSMSDLYCPPPGLDQFVWIGIVLLLDVAGGMAVRRMLPRYPT